MAGIHLNYNLFKLKALREKFEHFSKRVSSEKLAQSVSNILLKNTKRRFDTETDPDGKKWAPTLRGGQILTLKGHLRDSVTADSDEKKVVIGTNKKYAAIHQFGGLIKKKARTGNVFRSWNEKQGMFNKNGRFVKKRSSNFMQDVRIKAYEINMKKRSYLGISLEDEEDINKVWEEMLNESLNK